MIKANIHHQYDEALRSWSDSYELLPATHEIGRNYVGRTGDTTWNSSLPLEQGLAIFSREELEELGYQAPQMASWDGFSWEPSDLISCKNAVKYFHSQGWSDEDILSLNFGNLDVVGVLEEIEIAQG